MTSRIIFARMDTMRPNAIVIDKSWFEYLNAITIVDQDVTCCNIMDGVRVQTCVKKAWID